MKSLLVLLALSSPSWAGSVKKKVSLSKSEKPVEVVVDSKGKVTIGTLSAKVRLHHKDGSYWRRDLAIESFAVGGGDTVIAILHRDKGDEDPGWIYTMFVRDGSILKQVGEVVTPHAHKLTMPVPGMFEVSHEQCSPSGKKQKITQVSMWDGKTKSVTTEPADVVAIPGTCEMAG